MKRAVTVFLLPALAAASLLLSLSCKRTPVGDPPATPAAPSGITNGGINTSYDFFAITTDPDDDSVCFRFQWGDGSTSEWGDWVASGVTATMAHQWSSPNTYQVKTQAKDRPGSTSDWSATLTVTITSNRPPSAPATPTGPSSTRRDSLCTYTSIAVDPDGDGLRYRFAWGDGDTSGWSDWTQSGVPYMTTHAFPRVGTFEVYAQVHDPSEARSEWSNPLTVTVSAPVGTPRWCYNTGRGVWSSPAIAADGTVYVGSEDSCLYAINPDGSLKWRYQTGGWIRSSPAIASDGTIYLGSVDNCLYAVNPDGSLKWRHQTGGSVLSSPAVTADGTVYIGSYDSCLYAINPDGSLKWRYRTGGWIESSPATASDGTVYIGSSDSCLYAINPDGSLKWRYQTVGYVDASPAISWDGTIYIGSSDHNLYAIRSDGSLKWRWWTDAGFSSPSLASNGECIYVNSGHTLYAIHWGGYMKWSYGTGGGSSVPAITDDGTVYVGSSGGRSLYAISPSGVLLWRYQTGSGVYSSPAVASDGTIYIGSGDGNLYAIQGDGPLGNTPWPKFHHDNKNTGRVGGGGR